MDGVTKADPEAPSALDTSIDIAGCALAKAISRKHHHDQEKVHDVYRLVALAFSTCGEESLDMHG